MIRWIRDGVRPFEEVPTPVVFCDRCKDAHPFEWSAATTMSASWDNAAKSGWINVFDFHFCTACVEAVGYSRPDKQ
jgi:hypothetical protein